MFVQQLPRFMGEMDKYFCCKADERRDKYFPHRKRSRALSWRKHLFVAAAADVRPPDVPMPHTIAVPEMRCPAGTELAKRIMRRLMQLFFDAAAIDRVD